MVRTWGMSEALGPVRLEPDHDRALLGPVGPEYGPEVARGIDKEVQWLLEQQERRAHHALADRRAALEAAASALLDRETLSGEELQQLVEANQGAQAAA